MYVIVDQGLVEIFVKQVRKFIRNDWMFFNMYKCVLILCILYNVIFCFELNIDIYEENLVSIGLLYFFIVID